MTLDEMAERAQRHLDGMTARYIPRHRRPLAAPAVVHVHVRPEPPPTVLSEAIESTDPRRELWTSVAVAVAGSSNSTRRELVAEWADAVLAAYDQRFKSTP